MGNIQISQKAFFNIRYFMMRVDKNSLSDRDITLYEEIGRELDEKHNKMANRMRYSEMLKADNEQDRAEMLNLYHKGKKRKF